MEVMLFLYDHSVYGGRPSVNCWSVQVVGSTITILSVMLTVLGLVLNQLQHGLHCMIFDFFIGKAEVNKPFLYNFDIGIRMLARYSYRCRLTSIGCSSDILAMQSRWRNDVDHSVSYIWFLHRQRQVKYAILISLYYQHSDVGQI